MKDRTGIADVSRGTNEPLALAPPPGNEKFPALDGLRGVAVLTVIWFHAAYDSHAFGHPGWSSWIGALTFGPGLFLMMSGFLLYRPYVSARVRGTPRPTPLGFWRKRALRIFPGYWVAITLLAIYPGLDGIFTGDWWKYYGLLHIYFSNSVFGGLAVSWTICTEVSFYLLLPFVAYLGARAHRRVGCRRARQLEIALLLLVCALSELWHYHYAGGARLSAMDWARALWLPGQAAFFAWGMIMGSVTVPLPGARPLRDRIPSWRAFWIGAYGLALGLYAMKTQLTLTQMDGWLLNTAIAVLVFTPVVLGRMGDGGVIRLLSTRTLAWLGLTAYGAYLYHRSIVNVLVKHGMGGASFISYLELTAVVTGVAFIAGHLSYRFVELPMLRLKYGKRRSATPAAVPVQPPTPAPESVGVS